MKNRLTSLLLLLFLLPSTAACGNNNSNLSAETVWSAIAAAISEDTLPVMMDIDTTALREYYTLNSNQVIDFKGQMPLMNVAATEILVIHAQKKQIDSVLQAAENRKVKLIEKWDKSDESQSALVTNCQIVQNGDWALFVVAEKADEIVSAFNTYIDSNKK